MNELEKSQKVVMRYTVQGNSEVIEKEFEKSLDLMQWVINHDECRILTIRNEGRLVYERKDIA